MTFEIYFDIYFEIYFDIFILILMITVPKEKYPSFNFILLMLKEIGHLQQTKTYNQEIRSMQCLGYHENI